MLAIVGFMWCLGYGVLGLAVAEAVARRGVAWHGVVRNGGHAPVTGSRCVVLLYTILVPLSLWSQSWAHLLGAPAAVAVQPRDGVLEPPFGRRLETVLCCSVGHSYELRLPLSTYVRMRICGVGWGGVGCGGVACSAILSPDSALWAAGDIGSWAGGFEPGGCRESLFGMGLPQAMAAFVAVLCRC